MRKDAPSDADATTGDAAGPVVDASCTLGTPDHCAACGDRCPGPLGPSITTLRVCLQGQCDIQCREEYYDVDGKADNGCEFVDDLPVHDSVLSATNMGRVSDCDGVQLTTAVIPSDDRKHLKAPIDRPNGRPDFFALGIDDDVCWMDASVEVSLVDLPAAARYRVEAFYRCSGGAELLPVSQTSAGGQKVWLDPTTACTFGSLGDDSGTLFVSVHKVSGPHSNASYTLRILP